MAAWNPDLHPRKADGEFTHASVSAWARSVSERIGHDMAQASRGAAHPPGHAEAVRRAKHLWSVPDLPGRTERTDAEHDELTDLEQAFETYREHLGLERNPRDRGAEFSFVDEEGSRFNEYGERINKPSGLSRSPSMRVRMFRQMHRAGELRGGDENDFEVRSSRGETRTGRIGYGARVDDRRPEGGFEAAQAFVAHMKRVQPRARQDAARQKVRRTPRGTRVESWMDQASAQLARRSGRG